MRGRTRRSLHWLVFLLLMGALSVAYVRNASRTIQERPASPTALELRHLSLAEETLKDFRPDFTHSFSQPLQRLLPHRADGVVQPLWPWLAACLIGSGDTSFETARSTGANAQLVWTLAWLVFLGLVCARKFTVPAALLVMLLVGFQAFLPTVGPFTSDALFQVLFLLTWVACIFSLQRNSLWTYGLVGALGGFTYLTQDRVLPLLVVFVLVSTLRAVWEWLLTHFPREEGTTLWVPRNHGLGLLLLAAMFFFIAGPRLAESHQRFGSAFFTYHDQVRWLDDKPAAEAWIQQHPNTAPIQARDQLTLLQDYLSNHTPDVIRSRWQHGFESAWNDLIHNGGVPLALILGLLFLMFVAMRCFTPRATHAGQRLHPEAVPALLFMLLATGAYITIAAWDAPITRGEDQLRLLQAPLALGLVWGCESLLRRARRRKASPIFIGAYHLLLWALVALVSSQVIEGLQAPLSTP